MKYNDSKVSRLVFRIIFNLQRQPANVRLQCTTTLKPAVILYVCINKAHKKASTLQMFLSFQTIYYSDTIQVESYNELNLSRQKSLMCTYT